MNSVFSRGNILSSFCGLFLACITFFDGLYHLYSSSRPLQPDAGSVYAVHDKGVDFYVSAHEATQLALLEYASLFALGAILIAIPKTSSWQRIRLTKDQMKIFFVSIPVFYVFIFFIGRLIVDALVSQRVVLQPL